MTWDSGGSNSYRMGAEGKYDLQLAPSHDAEKLKPLPKVEQGAVGGVKMKQVGVSTEKSKVSSVVEGIFDFWLLFFVKENTIITLSIGIDLGKQCRP